MASQWARRKYTDITELRGPILVVRGVTGVGWEEFATIRDAGRERHWLVLEADRNLVVVQVLEGTAGLRAADTRVGFSGTPRRIPVGAGWAEPAPGGASFAWPYSTLNVD